MAFPANNVNETNVPPPVGRLSYGGCTTIGGQENRVEDGLHQSFKTEITYDQPPPELAEDREMGAVNISKNVLIPSHDFSRDDGDKTRINKKLIVILFIAVACIATSGVGIALILSEDAESIEVQEDLGFCGTLDDDEEIRATITSEIEFFGEGNFIQIELIDVDLGCLPEDAFSNVTFPGPIFTATISNCGIEKVHEASFSNSEFATTLTLVLKDNLISEIPDKMLESLPKLTALDLKNNEITGFDDDVFQISSEITNLDFRNNPVGTFPSSVRNLRLLVNLLIDSSLFQTIEDPCADFEAKQITFVGDPTTQNIETCFT